jgi:hypothetical protein
MKFGFITLAAAVLLVTAFIPGHAGTIKAVVDDSDVVLHFSGYNSLEFGQVVKGKNNKQDYSPSGELNGQWLQLMRTGFAVRAELTPRLWLNMNVQIKMWHGFPVLYNNVSSKQIYFNAFLPEANGTYRFGDIQSPFLTFGLGFFLFKYNEDARDLGEYLFRSTPFPPLIATEFDFCYAQPMGIRLNSLLLGGALKQDLFFTTNVNEIPIYDFSLAYLCSYTFSHFIEMGGGIRACSILPMDDKLTTPHDPNNLAQVDAATHDSTFYSYAGTIVMGRLAIDFKRILKTQRLGPEELRLYGEAAILGLEKRPLLYGDFNKKIPAMIGFQFPTFRLIDVLSVEVEWFGSRYPNNYHNYELNGLPIPDAVRMRNGVNTIDSTLLVNGPWRWCVYVKKSFGRHFSIVGQCARDHMVLSTIPPENQDFEETLRRPGDWAYMVKCKLEF